MNRRSFLEVIVSAFWALLFGKPEKAPYARGDIVNISLQTEELFPDTADWYMSAEVVDMVGDKVAIRSPLSDFVFADGHCPLPGLEADWKDGYFEVWDVGELRKQWELHERRRMEVEREQTRRKT